MSGADTRLFSPTVVHGKAINSYIFQVNTILEALLGLGWGDIEWSRAQFGIEICSEIDDLREVGVEAACGRSGKPFFRRCA
jgi:hypothetical protein